MRPGRIPQATVCSSPSRISARTSSSEQLSSSATSRTVSGAGQSTTEVSLVLGGHCNITGAADAFTPAWRARVARLLRVYPDSSDRLNDLTVRVRSLLANRAATGFINRIKPKSSPSAT
jgi:hypothetical protein